MTSRNSFSYNFADLRRTASSAGVVSRKEVVIGRFVAALQDTTLSKEAHDWWCSVLEFMGHGLCRHDWPIVQDFFFALLRSLDRNEMFVGDDFSRIAIRYFEDDEASDKRKEPKQLPLRLGASERQQAEAITTTIYFCRRFYLTGRCQLGRDCVLEHSCQVCLKKTGRRRVHTVHECDLALL
uniref:UDP-glucose:glycoprotein glucosyltransferase 1 n=1 Tax=Phallusia mammillata TaxID=59560 RepID=A0A6F9DWZ7_9ASCI|nr:UDP-glucose:glycoprotein glucosyltransferase 1 [Phallusia mammillata]